MLKKVKDEHVGSPTGLTERYLTSIKTGRTMQEIAAGKKAKELAGWKKMPKGTSSRRRPGSSPAKENSLDSGLRRNDGKGRASQPPRLPRAAEGDARRPCPVRLGLDPRDEI